MEKVEFPKWKYHATKESVVVGSKNEEDALGAEWVDNPAHIKEKSALVDASEEPAPKKSSKKAKE